MALPPELTEEIKKKIKEGEAAIKELEPEVQKAKMAGIDVSEELKRLAELKKKLLDLKLQYGK